MHSQVLLDTDILSMVMRKQPAALAGAHEYLKHHPRLPFSIITRYEILRGLRCKGAKAQLAGFERLCSVSELVPLSDPDIVLASEIYADLHQRGLLIGDADILIAASALSRGLTLVTNNEAHFRRIQGLSVENWLKPR